MMHNLYALVDAENAADVVKLQVEELRDVNTNGTIK